MLKFRKLFISVIASSMLLMVGCNSQPSATPAEKPAEKVETFPTKPVTGVIQWGAGGATDNVSRAFAPLAEQALGQKIILTNKPGATGAVATQYVVDQKADGYHLLFGAENPALYGVLGISKLGFEDLYPISIIARNVVTVVVPADSKYQTLEDLIADVKANPGKIKMGSTGPGGLPFVVTTMINSVAGTEFNMVPFDGEGPAITAALGGHVDVTIAGLAASIENTKAGKLRVLAVINDEPIAALPDAEPVTTALPDMKKYLPWGPFYSVWVKKDTPEDVKKTLVDAFAKGFNDPKFQDFLGQLGAVPMGIAGEEAESFWRDWQSTTAWLLHDAGAAKVSPEELGIPKKN